MCIRRKEFLAFPLECATFATNRQVCMHQGIDQSTAAYLRHRSALICASCGCTEEKHWCRAKAYLSLEGFVLDICTPENFRGLPVVYVRIDFPWRGSDADLDRICMDENNHVRPKEFIYNTRGLSSLVAV